MMLSERSSSTAVCPPVPTPAIGFETIVNGWTVQHLFEVLAGVFAGATCLVSLLLLMLHATHFSVPREQIMIMRIIFFFPILALISFGQVFLAADALYLQPWASLFEAFAIGSFFMLVSAFLSRFRSTSRYEEEAFRLKDGSSISHNVLSRKRIAVFQYALVAVVLGAVTDITLKANVYCETTNNAHFSKIWLTVFKILSVGAAAASLVTFTLKVKATLKQHQVFKKLLALKLIIIMETIQNLVFAILRGNLHPTAKFGYYDTSTGVQSLLLCIECFVVSILLWFTYGWQAYGASQAEYQGGFLGLSAVLASFNPIEIAQEYAYGFGLAEEPYVMMSDEEGSAVALHTYGKMQQKA